MVIRDQMNSCRYKIDQAVSQNNYITVSHYFHQIFHNMKAKVMLFPPSTLHDLYCAYDHILFYYIKLV